MPPLKIAAQMDPIENIDPSGDSTFAMLLEAQARGYETHTYHPNDLSLEDGVLSAATMEVELFDQPAGSHFTGQPRQTRLLTDFNVILLRQDPPFDMHYITNTHLLDQVHPKPYIVNPPSTVRNAPEKILVTHFPELMPATLITRDRDRVVEFRKKHKNIIVKPLYGNGGAGVFFLREEDQNLISLLEMFEQSYREPYMVQQYLPDVRQGDKRIIIVDGEPVAGLNRVPSEGEARSNMHAGGRPELSPLTDREKEICATIAPALKERDFIFVGIDVIGGLITEINVTSPTGLREIERFGGPKITPMIWDAIEKRL